MGEYESFDRIPDLTYTQISKLFLVVRGLNQIFQIPIIIIPNNIMNNFIAEKENNGNGSRFFIFYLFIHDNNSDFFQMKATSISQM